MITNVHISEQNQIAAVSFNNRCLQLMIGSNDNGKAGHVVPHTRHLTSGVWAAAGLPAPFNCLKQRELS
jgi:hypothetical protein